VVVGWPENTFLLLPAGLVEYLMGEPMVRRADGLMR
jgi:hypothetical protein